MDYYLRIIGKKASALTPKELKEFIDEGNFLPSKREIEIVDLKEGGWLMKIYYETDHLPMVLLCDQSFKRANETIEEIRFILEVSKPSKPKEKILNYLENAHSFFEIQILQNEITKDGWEMLDAVEAEIMRKCDGILYTSDNKFYDEKLKKFYKL